MSQANLASARTTESNRLGLGSQLGKRVGPYTICMELASGGMATVFLARSDSPIGASSVVALKVVHRHLAEHPDFVAMFEDEARISSQLRHQNVCQVRDFGLFDGTYYLAMECLVGEPLSAVFRRTAGRVVGGLERHAALVVQVAAQACSGLHAAHTASDAGGRPLEVVHRDVSPENLFLTYAGQVKVLDFGLASAKHQLHRTRAGIIKGKFAYLAPEALNGSRVDRRADVWSVAVVVWELLTGRRLFRGNSDLETLSAVAEAPIPPPSTVRPGLPRALDLPIMRALSRKPEQRQPTALRFAEELLAALPAAASVGEPELGSWLAQLSPSEKRWKSQVVELVERLSLSERSDDDDFDDAPTRIKSSSRAQSRTGLFGGRRGRAAFVPALVGLGLAFGTLWPKEPVVEKADSCEVVPGPIMESGLGSQVMPAANEVLESADSPPTAADSPPTAAVQTVDLSDGGSYLFEIGHPTQNDKALVLRIRSDQKQHKPSPRANVEPAPRPAPQAADDRSPPAWLRSAMQQERSSGPVALAGGWRPRQF